MASDPEIDVLRLFYEKHRQELYTYALSITRCGDAAEDAIQRVFARLLEKGGLPEDLRPYLYKGLRNAAIDHLRRGQRSVDPESLFDFSDGACSANHVQQKREAEQLLLRLPDDEREAIVLKIYSGFTFKEIGELMGVSINTAASWYRRGIERLRTVFREDEA